MRIADAVLWEFLRSAAVKLVQTARLAPPGAASIQRQAAVAIERQLVGHPLEPLERPAVTTELDTIVVRANAHVCRLWASMLRRPTPDVAAAPALEREAAALLLERLAALMVVAAGMVDDDADPLRRHFWRSALHLKQQGLLAA